MTRYAHNFERYKIFLNRMPLYDLSMFDMPKKAAILDIGSGFGDRIRALRKLGYDSVRGIEPDSYMREKSGDGMIAKGSVTDTGYPDESFDIVLVENVFHHIDNYRAAILEIERTLRPKGFLCFIEPRNSIPRRILDFVTFKTPLPLLFRGGLKSRKAVMGEEVQTGLYPKWLESHDFFFTLLRKHFQIVWLRSNLWFYTCKAQKGVRQ